MKKKQTLILKGELTDLNTYIDAERTNKYAAAGIKRNETQRVWAACKEQKLKPISDCRFVFFTWFSKNNRKDFDNIEYAQKYIWDGLVLAKVLPDDNQKNTPKLRIHAHFTDPKNPRIVIEFFPLDSRIIL